ncbi:MAG: dTDP-glucose 4,6-dehydratase [Chitinivibrionales bacterium]|nr:dTDP-glucose 4,6-dehydratase [Chitinivibrionales bacterium]
MKNLLVTGGCGFIGSNFILSFLNNHPEHMVVNLDKLTYAGNPDNLHSLNNNKHYAFVHGDITDSKMVSELFSRYNFTSVVHFAAESHVDRSITGPEIFVTTNVLGTQILLECAKKCWSADFSTRRFLHVSTDEVYGSLGPTGFFTEQTPIAPNSPYSASKAGSDLLVRAYHETYGFPALITRCSNNYGPFQYPEKLIPLMIANALDNKPLPVYGDGKNIRDWLYVLDHCAALVQVLEKGVCGQVYNIGGNNEWCNIDIVKKILAILKKPESLITSVPDRLGHDRRYAIDATKLRTELGWQPTISFEVGIEKTIQWYCDNESWWRKLQNSHTKAK